jgi:hypothetical protein
VSLATEIKGIRVIDQKAETISELAAATGENDVWVGRYARAQVENGSWEIVYKRNRYGRTQKAYRRKKD